MNDGRENYVQLRVAPDGCIKYPVCTTQVHPDQGCTNTADDSTVVIQINFLF